MTVISGATDGSQNNLSAQELGAIANGNIVKHTATEMTIDIPLTEGNVAFSIIGHGLVYNSDDTPTAGTVTSLTIKDPNTSSVSTWSGFSVSAVALYTDIETQNIAAFDNLLFGGDDTFTSHTAFGGNTVNDHFEGFGGDDIFNMQHSEGDDVMLGDGGRDVFNFGADFTAKEHLNGGSGSDTVNLAGNYAAGVTFGTHTMINVETLNLGAGFDYKLTVNNATVASGATLTVNAAKLGAAHTVIFNGAAETNGHFIIEGGKGGDTLTGGSQSDKFVYGSAAQSTSTHYDTINAFNFSSDVFDVKGHIGAIDSALSHKLSTASFDHDLTSAVSDHLDAHTAMLVTASGGSLKGNVFLVVDLNGVAGYQAGHDLVIDMHGATGTLATSDFI